MIDPWESLKVNPARQLLGGGQRSPTFPNPPGDGFSVYDISADCKNPVLNADVHIPGSAGHSGQWAPDGKTFYITPLRPTPSIVAVNVDDPTAPFAIPGGIFTFNLMDGGTPGPQDLPLSQLHDLEFSKDGNTAYITMFGVAATAAQNGFAVLDVSDFQQRRPDAGYRVIGRLTWDDGSIGAQNALPVTIAGKPYIVFADEAGGAIFGSCAQGKSANGFPRDHRHLRPGPPRDCRGDPARGRRDSQLRGHGHRADHLEPRRPCPTAASRTTWAQASSPTPATTAGWTTWTTPGSWPATASPPAFGSGTSTTSPTSRRWRTSRRRPRGRRSSPARSTRTATRRPTSSGTTTGTPPSPASPRTEGWTRVRVTCGPPPRTTVSW